MHVCRPLAVLTLLAGPALAQTPDTAPASAPAPMPDPLMAPDLQSRTAHPLTLSSLMQQSAWQDPVIAAARAQFKQMPQSCAAAAFNPSGELTIFAPPQFDAQGALVQGIWSERLAVTGCGTPRLLNVLTVLQPGTAPARIPTMPGTTHADPATQKGALQYAQAVAIRASQPDCRQQSFIDTKFDGYTGLPDPQVKDGRDGRAWREVWTLFACGSTYDITITFSPNAQGTQIVATNPVKRS